MDASKKEEQLTREVHVSPAAGVADCALGEMFVWPRQAQRTYVIGVRYRYLQHEHGDVVSFVVNLEILVQRDLLHLKEIRYVQDKGRYQCAIAW